MTKAELTAELDRLKLEHEAMASTLAEVENFVPPSTMAHFRRHYMDCLLASREAPPRYRP